MEKESILMKNIFPIKAYYYQRYDALLVRIISIISDKSAVVIFPDGDIGSVPLCSLELTNEEIERFFREEDDDR